MFRLRVRSGVDPQGTLEFRVRRAAWNSGDQPLIEFYPGEQYRDARYRLAMTDGGQMRLAIIEAASDERSGKKKRHVMTSSASLSAGEWHHIALTWKSRRVFMWIDRALVAELNGVVWPDVEPGFLHFIGQDYYLDELRISSAPDDMGKTAPRWSKKGVLARSATARKGSRFVEAPSVYALKGNWPSGDSRVALTGYPHLG